MRKLQSWRIVVRENMPLLVWTLFWSASWMAASSLLELPEVTNEGIGSYVYRLATVLATDLLPVVLLLLPLIHLFRGGTVGELIHPSLWRGLAKRYLDRRVLGGFLLVAVCMPVFYAAYRDWKTAMPAFVPFWFDVPLEVADRWMHGATPVGVAAGIARSVDAHADHR
jgi:hypothetical protein